LAFIHEAFIGLEVGIVLGHRILAEITLALLVEPPADLPESLDSFDQRDRVLVGTPKDPDSAFNADAIAASSDANRSRSLK